MSNIEVPKHSLGGKLSLAECSFDDYERRRELYAQGYTLARTYYDPERNSRIYVFEKVESQCRLCKRPTGTMFFGAERPYCQQCWACKCGECAKKAETRPPSKT